MREFERWVEERRALEHDGDTAFEKCALAAELRGDYATAEDLGALGVLSARLGRTAEADSIAARLVADPGAYTIGGRGSGPRVSPA